MKVLNNDERGTIIEVAKKADVLLISSRVGSRRANHYHKRFGHLCIVAEGCVHYYEREVGSKEKPTMKAYAKGETFDTRPMMEHLMLFPVETVFYCYSYGARDKENYEDDTVRLAFQLDEQ
jgi:hypothetical protein